MLTRAGLVYRQLRDEIQQFAFPTRSSTDSYRAGFHHPERRRESSAVGSLARDVDRGRSLSPLIAVGLAFGLPPPSTVGTGCGTRRKMNDWSSVKSEDAPRSAVARDQQQQLFWAPSGILPSLPNKY